MSGLIGLGTGYLTLRLRGAFFAIATLALAVVLQTLIVNWDFVAKNLDGKGLDRADQKQKATADA